jgi:nucleoside-diphosphate-sugar epimerase
MIITVVGGTGLVGQGIFKELSQVANYELHSLSRHGKSKDNLIEPVIYHAANLTEAGDWQELLRKSDWVIDAVGILFPSKSKGTTYEKNSVQPAKIIIDIIVNSENQCLFISANAGPFFMNDYMKAKKEVETYGQKRLKSRFVSVFPGIVYDASRKSSYFPARLLKTLIKIPIFSFLKTYRPIKRSEFAREIHKIIVGEVSSLTTRIK